MKLPREERRAHLRLNDRCVEIGGDSRLFRGLLAHFLGTTIGHRNALVCHACNNAGCSNPSHLYWGTFRDNWLDAKESGRWISIHERTIAKYGKEEYKKIKRASASAGGKAGGGQNALSKEDLSIWKEKIQNLDTTKFGWVSKLSTMMGCSHTHTKRVVKKYFPEVSFFQRRQK